MLFHGSEESDFAGHLETLGCVVRRIYLSDRWHNGLSHLTETPATAGVHNGAPLSKDIAIYQEHIKWINIWVSD